MRENEEEKESKTGVEIMDNVWRRKKKEKKKEKEIKRMVESEMEKGHTLLLFSPNQ